MNDAPKANRYRFITREGQPTMERVGLPRQSAFRDVYHLLLTLSWPRFVLVISAAYVTTNACFALLYLAGGDCIENARPGSFTDAFFFSVQTMATIGYGKMGPSGFYANVLVAAEAIAGLFATALATGLGFARFARPTARVMFSRVAVIATRDAMRSLIFRCANERQTMIAEAEIHVICARDETTPEGESLRRFHELPLVRSRNSIFAVTWTVIHPITEKSPLYGQTSESLAASNTEIVIALVGHDTAFSQTVHVRWSYGAEDIHFDKKLVDIIRRTPDGKRVMDFTHFHDLED